MADALDNGDIPFAVEQARRNVTALLPLVEVIARVAQGGGISGSIPIVQHLTLVITFVGASIAARDKRLLALSTAKILPKNWEPALRIFSSAAAVGSCAGLAVASWDLVQTEREFGAMVGWGIPGWVFLLSLPLGFAAVGGWLLHKRGVREVEARVGRGENRE